MNGSSYRIADEPRPGALAHIVVNPFWPFLAVMFGGAWLSWPWFLLNSYAVGSPTRRKELALVGGGFTATFALLLLIFSLAGTEVVSQRMLPYALLSLLIVKLGVTYWLHALQSSSFEIYEYYGGIVRQGFLVILAAFFFTQSMAPRLLQANPFLYLWLR